MKLYLSKQKRNRDLDEYLNKLGIAEVDFAQLNQMDKKLLIVGGGYSLVEPLFNSRTTMTITNIDLDPPLNNNSPRIINIKGDFTLMPPTFNNYDEVWALYSLPLYSPNKKAIFMFLMNAILSLKPSGHVRFFPLEFDDNPVIKTRDADFDMTIMECTNGVLNTLRIAIELGINCKRASLRAKDGNRFEEVVTLSLDFDYNEKQKINNVILGKIKKICEGGWIDEL